MDIISKGHYYKLATLDGEVDQHLKFVKRFRGAENHAGTINQEVLRVLIDRVQFLNDEIQWDGNKEILKHLRMALVLHEARALMRKVDKDELKPELVKTSPDDGHFELLYVQNSEVKK